MILALVLLCVAVLLAVNGLLYWKLESARRDTEDLEAWLAENPRPRSHRPSARA